MRENVLLKLAKINGVIYFRISFQQQGHILLSGIYHATDH